MKKFLLLTAALLSVSFSFISCDKTLGDVLQGTWKNVPGFSSSGVEEPQMIFVFDGRGIYTFENNYGGTAKGTYTINKENTIAYLHGVSLSPEGISHEYDSELELDIVSTPPSFIINTYFDTNLTDKLIVQLKFEKQ